MSESFVDLSYRGLSLGRRIKLTRVQAASGYLETPAPMPVGTSIAIATDEGLSMEAIVTHVHEQVGGATTAPGMQVTPTLEGEAAAWWTARIEAPASVEEAAAPVEVVDASLTAPMVAPRADRVTVRPRSHTVPAPPPDGALADLGAAAAAVAAAMAPQETTVHPSNDHGATTAMAAVDLAALGLEDPSASPRTTGQHAVVDDGQRTTVMDAVDPAALGLEVSDSGRFATQNEETTDVGAAPTPDDKKPAAGKKKRKKSKG